MGRIKQLDQPVGVHLRLPAKLVGRISLLLYSDAHGGVPYGKLSEFYAIALEEKLDRIEAGIKERTNNLKEDIKEQTNGT